MKTASCTRIPASLAALMAGVLLIPLGGSPGHGRLLGSDNGRADPPAPRNPGLSIMLAAEWFPAGVPIRFRSIVENPTPDPATIWICGYSPNHLIILMDERGAEPPLTPQGKSSRLRFFRGDREKNFREPSNLTSLTTKASFR